MDRNDKLVMGGAALLAAVLLLGGVGRPDLRGYEATAEGATALALTSMRKSAPNPQPKDTKPAPRRAEVPAASNSQPPSASQQPLGPPYAVTCKLVDGKRTCFDQYGHVMFAEGWPETSDADTGHLIDPKNVSWNWVRSPGGVSYTDSNRFTYRRLTGSDEYEYTGPLQAAVCSSCGGS